MTERDKGSEFGWRSDAYAWFVVCLLTLSFTCSMVDRMILVLLVKPIEAEFRLTDVQFSLLQGTAFTMLYVVMGLPLGRLADRYSRRVIGACSVGFWSLMTGACSLAPSFAFLFAARVGVGIGEAGLSPAANSLMSDYFPPEKLSRPLTFYSVATSAGGGIALIGGGAILNYFSRHEPTILPLVGHVSAWRATFFIACLPGLLVAPLFAFVREPLRKGRTKDVVGATSWSAVFGFVMNRAGFFVPHFLAAGLILVVVLGMQAWMPTHLIRTFHVAPGDIGLRYGLVSLVSGVGGLLLSGPLADRLAARGFRDSHIRVALWASLIAIIPAVLAPLMPTFNWAVLMAALSGFGFSSAIALTPVALQILVPNEMRGQVYAIYLFVLSVLGYAIGPTLVALLTEQVFADKALVGQAMALVAAVAGPLGALCFGISRKRYLQLAV